MLHLNGKRRHRGISRCFGRLLLLQERRQTLLHQSLAPRVPLAPLVEHPLDFLEPDPKAFLRANPFRLQRCQLCPGALCPTLPRRKRLHRSISRRLSSLLLPQELRDARVGKALALLPLPPSFITKPRELILSLPKGLVGASTIFRQTLELLGQTGDSPLECDSHLVRSMVGRVELLRHLLGLRLIRRRLPCQLGPQLADLPLERRLGGLRTVQGKRKLPRRFNGLAAEGFRHGAPPHRMPRHFLLQKANLPLSLGPRSYELPLGFFDPPCSLGRGRDLQLRRAVPLRLASNGFNSQFFHPPFVRRFRLIKFALRVFRSLGLLLTLASRLAQRSLQLHNSSVPLSNGGTVTAVRRLLNLLLQPLHASLQSRRPLALRRRSLQCLRQSLFAFRDPTGRPANRRLLRLKLPVPRLDRFDFSPCRPFPLRNVVLHGLSSSARLNQGLLQGPSLGFDPGIVGTSRAGIRPLGRKPTPGHLWLLRSWSSRSTPGSITFLALPGCLGDGLVKRSRPHGRHRTHPGGITAGFDRSRPRSIGRSIDVLAPWLRRRYRNARGRNRLHPGNPRAPEFPPRRGRRVRHRIFCGFCCPNGMIFRNRAARARIQTVITLTSELSGRHGSARTVQGRPQLAGSLLGLSSQDLMIRALREPIQQPAESVVRVPHRGRCVFAAVACRGSLAGGNLRRRVCLPVLHGIQLIGAIDRFSGSGHNGRCSAYRLPFCERPNICQELANAIVT